MLCKNGAKNGGGQHQYEDHVEQPAIDQALTGGVESIVGDECRCDLWQRERPHGQARGRSITEGTPCNLYRDPLPDEQREDGR